MTQSKWLRLFMLGAFLFSFTLVGCSDDADDADDLAEGETTDVEEVADAGDFDAEEMKEEMLEMNEEMYEIISGIESVEDVQDAEDDIAEIFEELAENMRKALANPAAMQKMEMEMQQDPKMKEWDEKINQARTDLETNHPEAFAELNKVMEKHGAKMQQVMMEAAQQQMMESMPDSANLEAAPEAAPGE